STSTLAASELRGLGAVLAQGGFHGKTQVVRLVAVPRVGSSVILGETECPELEGPCLDAAGPAIAHVFALLGLADTAPKITTNADRDVRIFELSRP
ncbi:MAG: hypothetical protein H6Q90_819, partial [Deltaproteobacteria bacterium]|nr:hypothetical protein [Deltaproteobacteria bacterium]